MSEVPIFDPKASHEQRLQHEWVTLDHGRVCVREMTTADNLFVLERSTRQGGAAGEMRVDAGGIQLWQVVVCCYNGPGADAQRIFDITDIPVIQKLRNADWRKIQDAIERVNSLADEEVAALQDFTPAGADGSAAISRSSASSNSTASPVR
jgi:hypothetical protein